MERSWLHRLVPHIECRWLGFAISRRRWQTLVSACRATRCGKWNTNGQAALVVGATFPAEIAQVRQIVGDMPLLIPGIGAQGGDIASTVNAGRTANASGMMINSSRAILYAKPQASEAYFEAVRRVATETRDAINAHR